MVWVIVIVICCTQYYKCIKVTKAQILMTKMSLKHAIMYMPTLQQIFKNNYMLFEFVFKITLLKKKNTAIKSEKKYLLVSD